MYLRLFFIGLSLFLSFVSPAQKSSKKYPKEIYLNEDRNKETKPDKASYLRKIDQINGQLNIKQYYYPSMKLHLEGNLSEENPIRFHGEIKWYYKNGFVEQISNYSYGQKAGLETFYNVTGQPQREIWNDYDKEKVIKVWDESGNLLVEKGAGHVVENNAFLQTEMHTFYRDSAVNLKYAIRKQKKDTIYHVPENNIEFLAQLGPFYGFIARGLNYPSDARRDGIQGEVHLTGIIDLVGNLKEIAIVDGFHESCDQEALRVVKMYNGKWKPGIVNGKPVKTRIDIIIYFKSSGY